MKQATRPTTTVQGRSPIAHPTKHLSYSQALGEPSPPINHETEILKGKVEALQTDLAGIKAELAKVKTLEAKVGKLDTTVNHVRDSLATLKKGQQTSNSNQTGFSCYWPSSFRIQTPRTWTQANQKRQDQ
jgi:hypothetical protein